MKRGLGKRGSSRRRRPAKRTARRPFRLTPLDPGKRLAVEKLLARVYQQAAAELREMEKHEVVELRARDAQVSERYAAARRQIAEALRAWGGASTSGNQKRL